MGDTQRSTKKPRYDASITTIGGGKTMSTFSNPHSNVLNVHSNSHLRSIANCKSLTVIKLQNTRVDSIRTCPLLYSLNICNNEGLEKLKLPSLREVKLLNVEGMDVVDLQNATDVTFDKLLSIRFIRLPSVVHLTMSNMPLRRVYSFPKLESLEMNNLNGNHYNVHNSPRLKKLIIRNCDIKQLANMSSFDEITIEDCKYLGYVEAISNVKKLTIVNCAKLLRVMDLSNIEKLHVSRCNHLRRISEIEARSAHIEYCFSLISAPPLFVDTLTFTRCPLLRNTYVHVNTKHLTLDHCSSLELVTFECNTALCYTDLTIRMLGDNNVIDIKDWYADKLLIKDNASLETVQNVYNVSELILIDCRELFSVTNVYILDELLIESCPVIESVTNVYGFHSLVLIDCEVLTTLNMYLAELKTVRINDCADLNLIFNGSELEELSLINCGIVLIDQLSVHSTIDTMNSRLLPDLSTNPLWVQTPTMDEDVVYEEAFILNRYMKRICTFANVIKRRVSAYTDRVKFLKIRTLQREDRLCDCPICQDAISPTNSIFTSCNHLFHLDCLVAWFQIKRACPLCNCTF